MGVVRLTTKGRINRFAATKPRGACHQRSDFFHAWTLQVQSLVYSAVVRRGAMESRFTFIKSSAFYSPVGCTHTPTGTGRNKRAMRREGRE